jgi:hypothetical protein
MIEPFTTFVHRVRWSGALLLLGCLVICSSSNAQTLKCVEVISSGSRSCTDSGGFDSTCASATCPAEFTLTGGGGACAAGDRKIKSVFPREDSGTFSLMCEKQGVDPQAVAICCRVDP